MTMQMAPLADEASIVARLRRGDPLAAADVMRRHNRMLWRIARSVLRHDQDAEDAVQDAYLRAFRRIDDFRGDASLGTWLARITVNEALRRLERRRAGDARNQPADEAGEDAAVPAPAADSPEHAAAREEIRRMVEHAVDRLAPQFRIVVVMRLLEQMSIEETAAALGIPEATVKTRLHRATLQMRQSLGAELASVFDGAFPFGGRRCDRLTGAVLARWDAAAGDAGGNLSA